MGDIERKAGRESNIVGYFGAAMRVGTKGPLRRVDRRIQREHSPNQGPRQQVTVTILREVKAKLAGSFVLRQQLPIAIEQCLVSRALLENKPDVAFCCAEF
jgi:hypothetical protein